MNIIKLQGEVEKRHGVYYEYDMDAKPLGEGGMGRVFKGFRVVERTGERMPVAIKAIYENIPERVIERARREAAIQLGNDNLIHMYGFVEVITNGSGAIKNRVHYHVIMELLIGVTLESLLNGVTCDQNGMQIPFAAELYGQYTHHRDAAVIRIMKAVLSGLMALHDRGYIHRDVDPSNIMITVDGKIKLIDFGICKQIISLESQDKALTAAGVFMGKVNYAAPELVLGDVKNQNYSTDIYAMGILLYQLYVGHLPFCGTDQDVLAANLRKPLPMKDIHRNDIKKVIRKATDKVQSKRYASVAELRVDVEHLLVAPQPIMNRRTMTIIVSTVSVCVLLVVGVILFSKKEAPPIHASVPEEYKVVRTVPTQKDLFDGALQLMSMEIKDSVSKGDGILYTLALDSSYAPAMYEYGLTFAKSNRFFNIPELRQKTLGIKPDLKISTQWLTMALKSDSTNYKAAYWIVNNLIEENIKGHLDEDGLDLLTNTYRLFKQLVSESHEGDITLYNDALKNDEITLKAWGIIN